MEFGAIFWMSVVLHSLMFPAFCAHLAHEKKADAFLWAILGFFFGIFALISAVGLPDKKVAEALHKLLGEVPEKKDSGGFWN